MHISIYFVFLCSVIYYCECRSCLVQDGWESKEEAAENCSERVGNSNLFKCKYHNHLRFRDPKHAETYCIESLRVANNNIDLDDLWICSSRYPNWAPRHPEDIYIP